MADTDWVAVLICSGEVQGVTGLAQLRYVGCRYAGAPQTTVDGRGVVFVVEVNGDLRAVGQIAGAAQRQVLPFGSRVNHIIIRQRIDGQIRTNGGDVDLLRMATGVSCSIADADANGMTAVAQAFDHLC